MRMRVAGRLTECSGIIQKLLVENEEPIQNHRITICGHLKKTGRKKIGKVILGTSK